jgi:hypothetical protein
MEQARTLLSGDLPLSLQITLVQPGLSRAVLTVMGGNLFSAVDEFVFGGRCTRIKVLAPHSAATSNWPGLSDVFALYQDPQTLSLSCQANRSKTGLD